MISKGSGFFSFKIFSLYPNLVNIITTRQSGNFLPLKSKDTRPLDVLERFGISPQRVVRVQQTYGSTVAMVRDIHSGQTLDGDALFTDQKNLFLLIMVADCMPIFFYDPIRQFVACSHSGWQGTLQKIAINVVEEFMKKGSKKEDILIAGGPSICVNHYPVPSGRADLFNTAFGKGEVVVEKGDKVFLDLRKAIKHSLLSYGIPEKNTEFSEICTVESNDEFYSYRAEHGLKGEFAAVIGLKK